MNQGILKHYRKAFRKVLEAENEDESNFLFLEKLFQAIYDFHTTYKDIHDGKMRSIASFCCPF